MLTENQEILEGRFKIIKKLGSGAFGEIFKGKHWYFEISDSYENFSPWNVLFLVFQFYAETKFYTDLCISVVEKKKTGEFYAAKIVSETIIHFLKGKPTLSQAFDHFLVLQSKFFKIWFLSILQATESK